MCTETFVCKCCERPLRVVYTDNLCNRCYMETKGMCADCEKPLEDCTCEDDDDAA